MPKTRVHDARYLESRVWEEMERCYRYGRSFSLLIFRELAVQCDVPELRFENALAIMTAQLRTTDIIAQPEPKTLAVLLVETDATGARRVLDRLRVEIGVAGWAIESMSFPTDSAAIEALPFLSPAA
jgi:hypothetical protein